MHDFAVKDLMVTVLPAQAAQDCPCNNTEECDDTTCPPPSEPPQKECAQGNATGDQGSSQATERDFKVLDRELRRILDQS